MDAEQFLTAMLSGGLVPGMGKKQLSRNNRTALYREIGTRTGLAHDEDGEACSRTGLSFEDYVGRVH